MMGGWSMKHDRIPSFLLLVDILLAITTTSTLAFLQPPCHRRATKYQLRRVEKQQQQQQTATTTAGTRSLTSSNRRSESLFELPVFRNIDSTTISIAESSPSPNNKDDKDDEDDQDDSNTSSAATKEEESKDITKIRPISDYDSNNKNVDNDDDADISSDIFSSPTSKFRRLKDVMWVRETLEDLTAAEFACSVEASDDAEERKKRRRAVDYDKLLTNLNRRMKDLGCDMPPTPEKIWDGSPVCELTEGEGMGTTVYTEEQRNALRERIMLTRQNLVEVLAAYKFELEQDTDVDTNSKIQALRKILPLEILPNKKGGQKEKEQKQKQEEKQDDTAPASSSLKTKASVTKATSSPTVKAKAIVNTTTTAGSTTDIKTVTGPKLYVRDDGTVDWDGALQDRAALKKFGTSVWARINGQDPDSVKVKDDDDEEEGIVNFISGLIKEGMEEGSGGAKGQEVTAKIEDTPAIKEARAKLDTLKKELVEMDKAHINLLNSAISRDSATANVKLATLEPALRSRIRESSAALVKKEEEVTYETLLYELERIYTYLSNELYNPSVKGYIPLQDRLYVAEFGLLESQILSFSRVMGQQQQQQGNNNNINDSVDTDLLAVVTEQMTDFKRRLGIDYYVTGFSYDQDTIQRLFSDFTSQAKDGIGFYVKGVNLLINDILFSTSLIGRAAQGYTLKPREVRNIRRTFKDIITFIPVVIIFLIPITPVGHVLVFGAIQRFFPDFFPSCFTEQRQNLLELYESTEYSEYTVQENLEEKVSRLFEAVLFIIGNFGRNLYVRVDTTLSSLGSVALTSDVDADNDVEKAKLNGSSPSSDRSDANGSANGSNDKQRK